MIKFVHASRERNGDFDVRVCMCVFYMADDVVFCGLVNLKTLNIETICLKNE